MGVWEGGSIFEVGGVCGNRRLPNPNVGGCVGLSEMRRCEIQTRLRELQLCSSFLEGELRGAGRIPFQWAAPSPRRLTPDARQHCYLR